MRVRTPPLRTVTHLSHPFELKFRLVGATLWPFLEGTCLSKLNPDHGKRDNLVTTTQLLPFAKQKDYHSKNAWSMFVHTSIFILVVIG
jgi:hypothetical protein